MLGGQVVVTGQDPAVVLTDQFKGRLVRLLNQDAVYRFFLQGQQRALGVALILAAIVQGEQDSRHQLQG